MTYRFLVICGPTATGKTALGIHLAKKYNGEIISADSRQVYQGMDIGTGKDLPVNAKFNPSTKLRVDGERPSTSLGISRTAKISHFAKALRDKQNYQIGYYKIQGVKIWLYDVLRPNQEFSVAQFSQLAWEVIKDILKRGKLPILVGGTGFYIKAIMENIPTKEIPPNWPLRKQMETKTAEILFEELAQLDSFRAANMNVSDRKNKRRLIRAIEIARWRKENPLWQPTKTPQMKTLIIGLKAPLKWLYQKIDERIKDQLKKGAKKEVEKLFKQGFAWDLPALSAMGYQEWQPYLEGKATLNEIVVRWKYDEHGYARRQITWFKKEKRIHWFDIQAPTWQKAVEETVERWYNPNKSE